MEHTMRVLPIGICQTPVMACFIVHFIVFCFICDLFIFPSVTVFLQEKD